MRELSNQQEFIGDQKNPNRWKDESDPVSGEPADGPRAVRPDSTDED